MREIILARMGEIALKGLNRGRFEQRLIANLKRRLNRCGSFQVHQSQSRFWIEPQDETCDLDEALQIATSVFGLVSASRVSVYPAEVDQLLPAARSYMQQYLSEHPGALRFKVESKRGLKSFPMESPKISAHVGGYLLSQFPQLSVDVHEPDFVLYVEVREELYLYTDILPGVKGLPIGSSGKGMLLLSGGIDSPVAGYCMASRGMELEAVYFHTYPYTSDRARQKVVDLAELLTDYCGRMKLHIVDFTEIQLAIRDHCPQDMMTIVMRRIMMRIAEGLAKRSGARCLITGESLGQVASQTLEALCTTDTVVGMPVFRPLIGMDKDDTVRLARKIGTFETSILPYEDCCTVFVARHPRTRPSLQAAERAESKLDIESYVEMGLNRIETLDLR